MSDTVDLQAILADANVIEVLDELDKELVGLKPVKQRIRETAAFLVVSKAREQLGLEAAVPSSICVSPETLEPVKPQSP